MEDAGAQQYIDLMAENLQLKDEIRSVREYERTVQLFTRELSRSAYSQLFDKGGQLQRLAALVEAVKRGARPVEPAETFAHRLKRERALKLIEENERRVKDLTSKTEEVAKKVDQCRTEINQSQIRIDRMTEELKSADKIEEELSRKILALHQESEGVQDAVADITRAIETEQAQSIAIKSSIAQAVRVLDKFAKQPTTETTERVRATKQTLVTFLEQLEESSAETSLTPDRLSFSL